ncbi:hypothetical protein QVD17_01645 [Tagetes erecta]|uniref:Uncharacterized protein n=1 Tax=Tagetes erecta TaxID=13708 RepID=A0AAD8P715_TARER|nr:hypothetical protein QVD17_01645 [Tagetes erecta]
MCHTSVAQRHDYNNTVLTSFLDSQNAPESVIYGFSHATNPLFHVGNDQEAGAQMATNEADSWLLSINPCYNQIDGPLNLASQEYGQFDHQMQSQGVQPQASIQPTSAGAGIIPEETFGTMNRPQEWAVKQVSFSPFNPGNLIEETVGSIPLKLNSNNLTRDTTTKFQG